MKFHYWIAALLSTMLFVMPSLAEDSPWYEIEIIVFTRDFHPASFNEVFPTDPGTPDFENAQPLQPDLAAEVQPAETLNGLDIESSGDAALPISGTTTIDASELSVPIGQRLPVPYTLIPEDEYRLKTEFRRLQLSNILQPVIHLAWRQPVTDQKHSKLLYLRTPEPAAEAETISDIATREAVNLEGTIRVSVNRYLHVELDLLNLKKQSALYSSYEQSFEDGFMQQPLADNRYRMQAQRRMRSGELHYIDHPLMGALVKITPYKLPKPVPIVPVEPEATDKLGTQAEETAATESNETATVEPEAVPDSQESGTTTSVIEIPPAKSEE